MTTFDKYLQAVLDRAELEAREDGSATVEAQHVLLAVAVQDGTDAQRALDSAGLDHAALKDALYREFEHSLSAAGVSLREFDLPRATQDPARRPQLGASFKLALERMAAVHRKKDLRSGHLLLGILQAEVGTVPRALAMAGVDRTDLIERVRGEL
ncbi:Clp protease N-terminal domain-containing protein [Streptomyces sp. NBC_00286]|uniref:Clp protease N-terminal domain-containing protein n=1 Tax=Streptomyces sp. NBC_00286 TaxID=2975701 RepID=UPI002E29E5A8|nr:Clp protease N-terminal domain-containing protein [Streptomyces sp. NBC_00286]